jgi:DNA-binding transcriptional MerR regulator
VSEVRQIPEKASYKTSEVCRYTDTQPYVLRFWESEFPQLTPGKGRGGQMVYSRGDIDLVFRIKQLLYEEQCTLDDARRRLVEEAKRKGKRGRRKARKPAVSAAPASAKAGDPARAARGGSQSPTDAENVARGAGSPERKPAVEFDTVPRERYEGAVDEIAHLRLTLEETESKARKAERQVEKIRRSAEEYRGRCEKAIVRLEGLLKRLE